VTSKNTLNARNLEALGAERMAELLTTSGSDTEEERTQRAWRLGGSPGRLDQHDARVATTALADAAMLRQTKTRLAHPRIEPDIAHEFLRRGEASDVANRGDGTLLVELHVDNPGGALQPSSSGEVQIDLTSNP
jgi:hypothetical protein